MNYFRTKINNNAVLTAYIHDECMKMEATSCLPSVLVFPGGGYDFCSEREGEPVAIAFMAEGYNAFVLEYSTGLNAENHEPLYDAALAMYEIKRNAREWHVDPSRIVTVGFSAGGHLAGWLGNSAENERLQEKLNLKTEDILPAAQVLCYPVVTSGKYRHDRSFKNLFGNDIYAYEKASLEKNVNNLTPPTFIWACNEDKTVPAINSLLLAEALYKRGIRYELHSFVRGGHGLSMATEFTARPEKYAEKWFYLCLEFLEEVLGN